MSCGLLKNAHLLRFRPPHRLGGVARVAPYSSRRHPSSFAGALHQGIFEQPAEAAE